MNDIQAVPPHLLTMAHYTKGSKAVQELRLARYREDQAAPTTEFSRAPAAIAAAAPSDAEPSFDFGDLLDIVNPLQHIPIVSTLYREISGDEVGPVGRIAGGALFGGVIGAVSSLANVLIEEVSGRDLGGHALALFTGEDAAAPATLVAAADAAPTAQAGGRDQMPPADEAVKTAPQPPATPSALGVPGPLPQLSAAAFDALLRSVSDPETLRARNPALNAAIPERAAELRVEARAP